MTDLSSTLRSENGHSPSSDNNVDYGQLSGIWFTFKDGRAVFSIGLGIRLVCYALLATK